MKIDGRCHCGDIAYEAEVEPEAVTICHCTDCQMLSGTTYRASIATKPGTLKILRGTPKAYVKIGDSGARRRQTFCANCGTHLFASADEDAPETVNLRAGTVTQRAAFRPKIQIWTKSALPWFADIPALPGVSGQR